MAYPEELAPLLPDTLPDDFSDWDREGSSAALAVHPEEEKSWVEAGTGSKPPELTEQADEYDAMLPPAAGTLRDSRSVRPAPGVVQQHEDFNDWDSEAVPTALPRNPDEWEAWSAAQSNGKTAKPTEQSAQHETIPPAVDGPRAPDAASPGPVIVNQREDSDDLDHGAPTSTAKPESASEWEEWSAAHSLGKTAKPQGPSAEHKVVVPIAAEKLRNPSAAPAATRTARPQRYSGDADHGAAYATARPSSNEWEEWSAAYSLGKTAKPPEDSAERKAVLSIVADRPRETSSGVSAPATMQQQESAVALVDAELGHALQQPEVNETADEVADETSQAKAATVDAAQNSADATTKLRHASQEALFRAYSAEKAEKAEETKAGKKKLTLIAGAGASSLLLLVILMNSLGHHRAKPVVKQPAPPVAAAINTMQTTAPPPAVNTPALQGEPAATVKQPTPENQPAGKASAALPRPAVTDEQTAMMNNQLAAPTRIPQDAKKPVQVAEEAPPSSFGGTDGLGGNGTNGGIFNGHAQPVVKAVPTRPIAISSGIATGMLILKTPPAYPSIAKTARVSGTVQLRAIISKAGTIKDLQVVSGPVMLRQAAVDAVRTWRYRPYTLNNEPTEVETTINVVFSLGT